MYGLARFPNPTAPEAIEAGHATRIHPPTQFGLIVSKKIDKRATRRNRIKRQLREAIRHYLDSPESACMQRHYRAIIIIARADLLQASFQAIRNRLETCLRHHA
jgi:ribonuclease P protein component